MLQKPALRWIKEPREYEDTSAHKLGKCSERAQLCLKVGGYYLPPHHTPFPDLQTEGQKDPKVRVPCHLSLKHTKNHQVLTRFSFSLTKTLIQRKFVGPKDDGNLPGCSQSRPTCGGFRSHSNSQHYSQESMPRAGFRRRLCPLQVCRQSGPPRHSRLAPARRRQWKKQPGWNGEGVVQNSTPLPWHLG